MTTIAADYEAARELIGCQYPKCLWAGVVEVQFTNAEGPKQRLCRAHAAAYRMRDDVRVIDSMRKNRLLSLGGVNA